MIDLKTCPVCGGPADRANCILRFDSTPEGRAFPTRLVECACRHVFSNPQPSWEEVKPLYDEQFPVPKDRSEFDARVEHWVATRFDGRRLNHVPILKGGRYLDVGCNLGDMVAAMSRMGMVAEGVEPREAAARFANENGMRVFCGTLETAAFPDGTFDRISMYHVLEHTPDPVAVLSACRRILKPGGILVVGVPNFDAAVFAIVGPTWQGLSPPKHYHHFRPATIALAAERAGLAAAEVFTESIPAHGEVELAKWLRRRLFVPMKLTLRVGATRPFAARIARRAAASGRGDAIVALLKRPE